jgi:ribosomal-protein-alanine N-acetyltransferase
MYLITTPRLRLREFTPGDANMMFRLNADPDVLRYTGDAPFSSVAEARQFLRDYDHFRKYGYGRWAVERKADGEVLGWCGLKWHEAEQYVDLGFRFFRKHWGQGYATEAGRACVAYGFENLGMPEIIGRVARAHVASIRVLEKVGMRFWKEAPCERIDDSLYYRISNAGK